MESSFALIAVSELGKTAVELASAGMDLIFNTDDIATNNIKLLMMYSFK